MTTTADAGPSRDLESKKGNGMACDNLVSSTECSCRWLYWAHFRSVAVDASRVGGEDLLQRGCLPWEGDGDRAMVVPPIVQGLE